MSELVLRRFMMHPEYGTFGELTFDGAEKICYTVERPWVNNEPNISCVPPGMYYLHPFQRPNGDIVPCLVNEDAGITMHDNENNIRWGILIHPANWSHEVEGCIGPGLDFEWRSANNQKPMVINSRNAQELVMSIIERKQIDRMRIQNPH